MTANATLDVEDEKSSPYQEPEFFPADKIPPIPGGLLSKIMTAARTVGAVEKLGKAPGDMGGYTFHRNEDVVAACRRALMDAKVWILPEVTAANRKATKTKAGAPRTNVEAVMLMHLAAEDESGNVQQFTCRWRGEAQDNSDKGLGKAETYAMKSFLIKLLQIPTDDDTETDEAPADTPATVERNGTIAAARSQKVAPAAAVTPPSKPAPAAAPAKTPAKAPVKAPSPTPAAAPTNGSGDACAECEAPLTAGTANFSRSKFGRPLCLKHRQQPTPQ